MWRDEKDARHPIGLLWRTACGFAFAYEEKLPSGFHLLPEFPEHRVASSPYEAPYLFPTFAERIPSLRRPDYPDIMASWGVTQPDDMFQVLAYSGGIQATDWVELSEWRADTDSLDAPLRVRAAGARYHPASAKACVGDNVQLVREPDNVRDVNATLLVLGSGERIGYVPKPFAVLVARLLDAGVRLRGTVERRLNPTASYSRLQVVLQREAI